MAFDPISREEADKPREYPLLQPGSYHFSVKSAKSKFSANGNDMIVLELEFFNDGKSYIVFDYLVAIENMAWKVRHFADAVGLDKQYEAGLFSATMCLGRKGLAEVGIKAPQPNPNGGMYPQKNVVVDYLLIESNNAGFNVTKPVEVPAKTTEFVDDDIPF